MCSLGFYVKNKTKKKPQSVFLHSLPLGAAIAAHLSSSHAITSIFFCYTNPPSLHPLKCFRWGSFNNVLMFIFKTLPAQSFSYIAELLHLPSLIMWVIMLFLNLRPLFLALVFLKYVWKCVCRNKNRTVYLTVCLYILTCTLSTSYEPTNLLCGLLSLIVI